MRSFVLILNLSCTVPFVLSDRGKALNNPYDSSCGKVPDEVVINYAEDTKYAIDRILPGH